VTARERAPQDDRRDDGRAERCDQRVLRGESEPPAALPRRERAGDERVQNEPEAQEERCAAERGHYVDFFAGVYFDGHFVESVPGFATNVPLRSAPSTTTSRPARKRSGTVPRYETGIRRSEERRVGKECGAWA